MRVKKKDLKYNKHNSLHLGKMYAPIFVLGHYLFLEAHSFPRAPLSENCLHFGTDNVRGQISLYQMELYSPRNDPHFSSCRPRSDPQGIGEW